MLFITLAKFRKKPTKAMIAETTKLMEQGLRKVGVKKLAFYWTLGRYETVLITEGKDEKAVMKLNIRFGDVVSQETLIGVPREEARALRTLHTGSSRRITQNTTARNRRNLRPNIPRLPLHRHIQNISHQRQTGHKRRTHILRLQALPKPDNKNPHKPHNNHKPKQATFKPQSTNNGHGQWPQNYEGPLNEHS